MKPRRLNKKETAFSRRLNKKETAFQHILAKAFEFCVHMHIECSQKHMADVFLVYTNSSVHLVAQKMEYTTPCLSEKVMPRGWIQREDSDLHRATERRVVEPIEGWTVRYTTIGTATPRFRGGGRKGWRGDDRRIMKIDT
jgi:hypothetical protein